MSIFLLSSIHYCSGATLQTQRLICVLTQMVGRNSMPDKLLVTATEHVEFQTLATPSKFPLLPFLLTYTQYPFLIHWYLPVSMLGPLFSLFYSYHWPYPSKDFSYYHYPDKLKSIWWVLASFLNSRLTNLTGRLASSESPAGASDLPCPKVSPLPQPTQSSYLPLDVFLLFLIFWWIAFSPNHYLS